MVSPSSLLLTGSGRTGPDRLLDLPAKSAARTRNLLYFYAILLEFIHRFFNQTCSEKGGSW